jgi:hypothetical protein
VYRPEDVIVPVVADPPEAPLTIQVGLARLTAPPVAVNCNDWPGSRIALDGVTVVGVKEVEVLVPPVQPERICIMPNRQLESMNRACVRPNFDLPTLRRHTTAAPESVRTLIRRIPDGYAPVNSLFPESAQKFPPPRNKTGG